MPCQQLQRTTFNAQAISLLRRLTVTLSILTFAIFGIQTTDICARRSPLQFFDCSSQYDVLHCPPPVSSAFHTLAYALASDRFTADTQRLQTLPDLISDLLRAPAHIAVSLHAVAHNDTETLLNGISDVLRDPLHCYCSLQLWFSPLDASKWLRYRPLSTFANTLHHGRLLLPSVYWKTDQSHYVIAALQFCRAWTIFVCLKASSLGKEKRTYYLLPRKVLCLIAWILSLQHPGPCGGNAALVASRSILPSFEPAPRFGWERIAGQTLVNLRALICSFSLHFPVQYLVASESPLFSD